MESEFPEILNKFLLEGDEDDIYFGEIIRSLSYVLNLNERKLSKSDSEKLWNAIEDFVALMLRSGFIAINHFRDYPDKIEIWPDQSPAAVMKKIREKWIQYEGKTPDVWFLVWFRKTNPTPRKRAGSAH
jgi:hypothetical protein